VIFAILTETGQQLTLDHKTSLVDVLIDVSGGICGRAAYLWFRHQLADSKKGIERKDTVMEIFGIPWPFALLIIIGMAGVVRAYFHIMRGR
jgi:hypothetical protein